MMKLSILGIYNYDESVFEGLEVPEGVNKQDVIDEILTQCAELEILYPDTDLLKRLITIWSSGNKNKWDKLYNTMTIEYNPIWNVDADITENIDRDSTGTSSVKGFNETDWAEANKGVTDEGIVRTERRTGNIGVTATQDLIKKEREIADFNIIDVIVRSFKYRFCILVY